MRLLTAIGSQKVFSELIWLCARLSHNNTLIVRDMYQLNYLICSLNV